MTKNGISFAKYGLVKVIKGKFKGKFGYYDDDDLDYDGIKKSVV